MNKEEDMPAKCWYTVKTRKIRSEGKKKCVEEKQCTLEYGHTYYFRSIRTGSFGTIEDYDSTSYTQEKSMLE